jgi:predicted MPP superfamily phosphohydrolase
VGGVGDLWEDTTDLAVALSDVSVDCPRILLSHNPDFAEQADTFSADLRVDLQISGHTHGGQVQLPVVGAPMVPSRYGGKYAGGLVEGPRWPVIVSRGVGMAILPVRFGVEPEVGLIQLVRSLSS